MKKFMISLAIASIAMVSFAQETKSEVVVPTLKNQVVTNTFGSNWFIGGNIGGNFYMGAEMNEESLFDHMAPAVQVYGGKWHTPGYGWRVAYNGINIQAYENAPHKTFMNFHFDAMFNLSNLIFGYNEERIWNAIPYIGAGWGARKNYSDSDLSGSITVNTGLINTFRVSKHFAINLEIGATFLRNGFGGMAGESGHDMLLTGLVGVTYKFNKIGWEQAADVDAIMAMNAAALAELNTQLQAKESENASLKNQLAAAKTSLKNAQDALKAAEGKVANISQSVFFAFNSSKIASKKEIINLQALADAVKDSNAKLSVIGYADSATGSAEYNQKLSEARAQAVADKLIEMGVPQEKLIVEGKGGVAAEKPARLNRRVIISIAE
jgi:outer membrane protein OmpA-like peptidoglycan-associated protein